MHIAPSNRAAHAAARCVDCLLRLLSVSVQLNEWPTLFALIDCTGGKMRPCNLWITCGCTRIGSPCSNQPSCCHQLCVQVHACHERTRARCYIVRATKSYTPTLTYPSPTRQKLSHYPIFNRLNVCLCRALSVY